MGERLTGAELRRWASQVRGYIGVPPDHEIMYEAADALDAVTRERDEIATIAREATNVIAQLEDANMLGFHVGITGWASMFRDRLTAHGVRWREQSPEPPTHTTDHP